MCDQRRVFNFIGGGCNDQERVIPGIFIFVSLNMLERKQLSLIFLISERKVFK